VGNKHAYLYQRKKARAVSKTAAGKKRDVKRALAQGKPTVCVGKDGASVELLKEIEKQLKKEEMVKVGILKGTLVHGEAKQIATKIAEQTGASLVEVRGHTFMLYKPDRK
jgi:RNA-binding protein